jgi:hypothetical protein
MYVDSSGNLHYVNSTSTDIQLTSGGGINVNVSARDSNAYGVKSTAISSPYQSLLSDDFSYYKVPSGGAFTFKLPYKHGSDPIASTDVGRFITIKAPSDAYTNNVTVQVNGTGTGTDFIDGATSFVIDSDNASYTFVLRLVSGDDLTWDVI